jgi:hypothetical protein
MRHLRAPLAAVLLVGCLDARSEQSQNSVVDIRADTTVVGRVTFLEASTSDPASPNSLDQLKYTNTTTRTYSRLSLAVAENLTQSADACVPPRAPFVDSVFTNVVPGTEKTVVRGILPGSMVVYVTEAVSAGTGLTNIVAGRWTGTYTEFTGTTTKVYPTLAWSQSGGRVVTRSVLGGDSLIFAAQLANPRPLSLTAFPGTCGASYVADPALARVSVTADSMVIAGAAVPSAATTGSVPDSFRLRLSRRP